MLRRLALLIALISASGCDREETVNQELRATLGEFTPQERAARPTEEGSPEPGESDSGRPGLAVQPLTPALARQLGISDAEGRLVVEVDPFGPAADAGIQRGDVIEQANQQPVRSVADLGQRFNAPGKILCFY